MVDSAVKPPPRPFDALGKSTPPKPPPASPPPPAPRAAPGGSVFPAMLDPMTYVHLFDSYLPAAEPTAPIAPAPTSQQEKRAKVLSHLDQEKFLLEQAHILPPLGLRPQRPLAGA